MIKTIDNIKANTISVTPQWSEYMLELEYEIGSLQGHKLLLRVIARERYPDLPSDEGIEKMMETYAPNKDGTFGEAHIIPH